MSIDLDTRFRIDSHNVVHETIDGEVIIIHLLNGSYYSLAGGGPRVWDRLAEGASHAELTQWLSQNGVGEEQVAAEMRDLLERLAADGLIVADPAAAGGPPAAGPGAYESAVLEKYTDMKDYFLLDPIHEVDTTGWPNRQE